MILEIKEISITDPAEALCELVRVLRAQGLIANTSPTVPEEPEKEPEWMECKDGAHVDVNDNECLLVYDNTNSSPSIYTWGEGAYVISGYKYKVIKR